eukprot:EG_transcript_17652
MRLQALPNDIVELVVEHLTFEALRSCAQLCQQWRSVIQGDPVLAARINLEKAVTVFNAKGQLGIEFIRSIGMITDAPEDAARWLELVNPKLDPKEVGRFLGDKRNKPVLLASMGMRDYNGLHLDEALRKCLATMQPATTTSGMRRILKAFARRFCACNPHYFCEPEAEASETAYLLCFAMLMLNTDAHNSTVHNKMTRQQFVAYISSSLNLKVKIPYLEGLYDRITAHEIRTEQPEDPTSLGGWFRSTFRWVSSVL